MTPPRWIAPATLSRIDTPPYSLDKSNVETRLPLSVSLSLSLSLSLFSPLSFTFLVSLSSAWLLFFHPLFLFSSLLFSVSIRKIFQQARSALGDYREEPDKGKRTSFATHDKQDDPLARDFVLPLRRIRSLAKSEELVDVCSILTELRNKNLKFKLDLNIF